MVTSYINQNSSALERASERASDPRCEESAGSWLERYRSRAGDAAPRSFEESKRYFNLYYKY